MSQFSSRLEETKPAVYTLILDNRLDELTRLADWINHLAGKFGLPAKVIFQLDLIVAEAVTNVINYAFENEKTHQITVTLQYQKHRVTVEIVDDGQPFDPLQHPPVVFPRKLEEASKGGLGIHLIRTYTDECHYRREGDKNILTLIMSDSIMKNSQDAF